MTDADRDPTGTEAEQAIPPDRLARYAADGRPRAMSDHARRLARHAGACVVLAGTGDDRIARGAVITATVEACRLAATAARSAQEFSIKRAALADFLATIVDETRRDNLAGLLDAGLSVEAEMRMTAGLPMQGHRLGGWLTPALDGGTQPSVEIGVAVRRAEDIHHADLQRYATAALADDVDRALADAARIIRDVIVLRQQGASTEGAWTCLERIAFALCAPPSGSVLSGDEDRNTLVILWRTLQRRRPLAAAIVRARLEQNDRRFAEFRRGGA